MNRFYIIEKTEKNPFISLDLDKMELNFEGRSLDEDPSGLYKNVFDWIDFYKDELSKGGFKVIIDMDYVNTSSNGIFTMILGNIFNLNNDVEVIWKYEDGDDDCLEVGEDYAKILGTSFTFIAY